MIMLLFPGCFDSSHANFGDGVPLRTARTGLMTPTTLAFAAVELILCVRVMPQEVFVP